MLVTCLYLLYPVHIHSVAYPYVSSNTFGAGSGPIFLSHLNCVGSEQTLLECGTSSYPYYYSHVSNAGVQCEQRRYSGNTVYMNQSQLLSATWCNYSGHSETAVFILCQVAQMKMAPFDLLGSPLMKAEWRSASMECGGQCVMTPGTPGMPEWSAES